MKGDRRRGEKKEGERKRGGDGPLTQIPKSVPVMHGTIAV